MLSKSILVIDDDRNCREALFTLLEMEGYQVRQAENGLYGLEMAMKNPPDLILLDLEMPFVDGWTFLEIRDNNPALGALPLIIVSGEDDPPASTCPFIRKPVDFVVLKWQIRSLLGELEEGSAVESAS